MAERLPRYRPLGVGVASVPAVDYTTAARMRASGYTDMAAALNKMSSFVFEKAGEFTKEEAIKFRYDNPVTPEQMQAAMDGGRDLDEIIGDRFTIFGRASRATAAVQLKTQLEAQAKNKLAEINAAMSGGADINIGSMKNDLNNMINGHSNLLAQIDPQSAYQYSAAVNTLASSTYRNALEREYKLRQAGFKDVAERQVELLPNILEEIIRSDTGATVTLPDGRVVPEVEGKIAIALRSTNDAIVATNDPDYIVAQRGKVRDVIYTAKMNVLVDHALSSDFSGNIDRGDFGRYTNVYVGLTNKQQAEVRKNIREERKARADTIAENKKNDNDKMTGTATELMVAMSNAKYNSPDYKEKKKQLEIVSIKSNGAAISAAAINSFDQSLSEAGKRELDSPALVNNMQSRILRGEIIDVNAFDKEAKLLGLSATEQIRLREMIPEQNSARAAAIAKAAYAIAKIVPVGGFSVSSKQAEIQLDAQRAIEENYKKEFDEWSRTAEDKRGPVPTIKLVANKYLSDTQSSKAQEAIDSELVAINKDFGKAIGERITELTALKSEEFLRKLRENAKSLNLTPQEIDDIKARLERIFAKIQNRRPDK
jgi:hypothetical protein